MPACRTAEISRFRRRLVLIPCHSGQTLYSARAPSELEGFVNLLDRLAQLKADMKHVHLDTSHLINGLESLLPDNSVGDKLSTIDVIDLLSHIVCRDKIFYDGDIFGKQKERLEKVIHETIRLGGNQGSKVIESKLEPFHSSGDCEAGRVSAAVNRVASNAARLRAKVRDFAEAVEHCSHLPSADDFTVSVVNVLIPQLKRTSSLEGVDAIWTDKSIAGRRFIWAALKDEETRNTLRGAIAGLKSPTRLFQLMFAHFRAEYAIERNKVIAARDSITRPTCFMRLLRRGLVFSPPH